MKEDILKVVYFTSEKGLYISSDKFDYQGKRHPVCGVKFVNGKTFEDTHLNGWKLIPGETEIKLLEGVKSGGYSNRRYELIDKSLHSSTFPLTLTPEEVEEWRNDDGEYCWGVGSQYKSFRSLYVVKEDRNPDIRYNIPFIGEHVGEITSSNVDNISKAKFNITKTGCFERENEIVDLTSIVHYYELEQMLVADLLIHNRPCYLTSESTYDIVRNHIKSNINPKYAVITSDYDFCFTVKKKIAVKPVATKKEQKTSRGKSYNPPRFITSSMTHKQIEIFEMTSEKKKYGHYSVIKGFKGESLEDLSNNIKAFLDELMDYINSPLSECSCCNGTGHVLEENFELNKRT